MRTCLLSGFPLLSISMLGILVEVFYEGFDFSLGYLKAFQVLNWTFVGGQEDGLVGWLSMRPPRTHKMFG